MGAGSSKPSIGGPVAGISGASYSTLLKVQERDNMAFARIFKRMIENITPKELRELYSINQCKKYHFALGQALSKIFYFTPVRGLQQQPIYWLRLDSQKKEEQADPQFFQNCFQVAYFYIRLLQIFCALSISTKSNEAIPYSGATFGGPMAQFMRFPGMTGGAPAYDIDEALSGYLDDNRTFKDYSTTNTTMSIDDDTITLTKRDFTMKARITYETNTIKLDNFMYNENPMDELKFKTRNIPIKTLKSTDNKYRTVDNIKISEKIYLTLMSIKQLYDAAKGKKKTGAEAAAPGRGAPQSERRELRVEYLVDRLSGSSNKPYAVARALQLIDLQPHESYAALDAFGRGKRSKVYTTHIFDFEYSGIIGNAPALLSAQQLKEFNETSNTLANVLGLGALDKLYKDDWEHISKEAEYRIKPSNPTEYIEFLKKIYNMYNGTSIAQVSESQIKADSDLHIFKIENKSGFKGSLNIDIGYQNNRQVVAYLQALQSKLFGLQLAHNEQVKKFIQTYIIADTPRGPMPNPKIFQIGLPYINALGAQARQLLLSYYMKAEQLYRMGYDAVKSAGITK